MSKEDKEDQGISSELFKVGQADLPLEWLQDSMKKPPGVGAKQVEGGSTNCAWARGKALLMLHKEDPLS